MSFKTVISKYSRLKDFKSLQKRFHVLILKKPPMTWKFKTRYSKHKQSFKKPEQKNETELSKHVWALKDKNIPYSISWRILGKAKAYLGSSKRCNLCILEKYFIICHRDKGTLNKKTEMVNTCRHRNKFLLQSVTWDHQSWHGCYVNCC